MVKQLLKRFHFIKFLEPFPRFRLGSLLVAIFCSFLIVIATFTPVPLRILAIPGEALSNTGEFFANLTSIDQVTRLLNYIPQIPIVIMIASMLGPGTGMLSVFLYVGSGLIGFPVFASGGGISYIFRLGFGYILGFFAGTIVTGKILSTGITRMKIVKAAILGVLAIHLVGIIYMGTMLLLKQESIFAIFGWIWQLSGMQILYDLIFALAAAFLGRFLRKALWIAMD